MPWLVGGVTNMEIYRVSYLYPKAHFEAFQFLAPQLVSLIANLG
jgi:hypothetical protein